jgi:hypothetical protein
MRFSGTKKAQTAGYGAIGYHGEPRLRALYRWQQGECSCIVPRVQNSTAIIDARLSEHIETVRALFKGARS